MRAIRAVAVLALLAIVPPAVSAQDAPKPDADSGRLKRPLFLRSDLYVLGAFATGTVAMFPLDRHLASVIRDEDLLANQNLLRASKGIRFFGGQGPYFIGAGMYLVGRLAGISRAAELGVHGTEALVMGHVVAITLKGLLGRARPYISSDTNPRSFAFGRGFRSSDFQSFPSGHATAAFSAASAVYAETSEWWPRTRWIFGPILYGGATLVGLSRMYDDKHWASDVVMGAAVGTFAGLKVVRFNHTHEGNRIDRWLLGGKKEDAHLRLHIGEGGAVGMGVNLAW